MDALRQLDDWHAHVAAGVVLRAGGELARHGPSDQPLPWASVTKLLTGLATLVALEEGIVDLDEPAGPEGSTLRHLLAHASGLAVDDPAPLAPPGRRRIYSNAGIEAAAERVAEAAEMSFEAYFDAAVRRPLGLTGSLRASPAHGFVGPLDDLARIAAELLAPTLVAPETLEEATSVQFPGLNGVLPGFGRMDTNDWGLTFELRDGKAPHWTSARSSPRTFGHFGATGTFLWVDPDARVACGVLSDRAFGEWAIEAWPRLNDAVVDSAVVREKGS